MPLRVIKLAPSLAVSDRCRRLAGIKACCPAAVMRLQTQSTIFFVLGHLQELFRKPARVQDTIGILLPDAEDGHEALTLGTVPLAGVTASQVPPELVDAEAVKVRVAPGGPVRITFTA